MTDVQEELERAMRILSAIPVSGNGVDFMAAAKQCLRRAIELCESAPQKGSGQNG